MPDREKVIKGLECCMKWTGEPNTATCHCSDCSYTNMDILGERCLIDLINDALALLKEQETVEPILIREGRNKNYNDYVCPRCDNVVVYEQNYCSECGVRFLWEGR